MLGGANAVLSELKRVLPSLGAEVTLLDVGTGLADIPAKARAMAARNNVRLHAFGVDEAETLSRVNADILNGSACADARRLPFASSTFDVVICSQVLHHFEDSEIPVILRELDRVASRAVIVSDLRRSWLALSGFWLVTWPLGFHPVSRHDGMASVLRGFTGDELALSVRASTGHSSVVRRHLGHRLTATWAPTQ